MNRRTFVSRIIAGAVALGGASASHAQERRYLSEEQALNLVFPNSGRVVREEKSLTDERVAVIQKTLRAPLNARSYVVHRGETHGATDGYAMILDELGKDQLITFIVGLSADFKVQKVALMVFRESRGWEVQDARFTNQFRNKTSHDRLSVSSDIIGVTGATLSSRALCRGVKKALVLCENFYR
jgi:Na+-translocating ferredoxin:NAD+ oxidoreductase RnfG subunit